jgi:hypothetical protein
MKSFSRCWQAVGIFLFSSAFSAFLFAEGPQVRPATQLSNSYLSWMKKVADWQLTQSTWNSP